jgi:hypothetical protein
MSHHAEAAGCQLVNRYFIQASYYQIRAGCPQQIRIVKPGNSECHHAAGVSCFEPSRRVLHHEAFCRRQLQLCRGEQKDLWIRLASGQISPADVYGEEIQ